MAGRRQSSRSWPETPGEWEPDETAGGCSIRPRWPVETALVIGPGNRTTGTAARPADRRTIRTRLRDRRVLRHILHQLLHHRCPRRWPRVLEVPAKVRLRPLAPLPSGEARTVAVRRIAICTTARRRIGNCVRYRRVPRWRCPLWRSGRFGLPLENRLQSGDAPASGSPVGVRAAVAGNRTDMQPGNTPLQSGRETFCGHGPCRTFASPRLLPMPLSWQHFFALPSTAHTTIRGTVCR